MPTIKKKPASKPPKRCKCAVKLNKELAPKQLELDDCIVMSFGPGTASGGFEAPLIRLRWLDRKKKKATPTLFCAYCPFCGKKQREDVPTSGKELE